MTNYEYEVFDCEKFYTVRQVADRVQTDPKTVYNAIKSGKLPVLSLNKKSYRIYGGDLNIWLAKAVAS